MKVLPITRWGSWGLWLLVGFAGLFVLKATVSIPVPSMVIFGVGIGGIIATIVALIRRERSVLFFALGGVIAVFLLFWLVGELVFPH